MTQQEIKNKIASLERGIKSPVTPANMKKQMEAQLEKLKSQLGSPEPTKKKSSLEKGMNVHAKNVPENIGTVGSESKEGWYVKFKDGSDGYFDEKDLVIIPSGKKVKSEAGLFHFMEKSAQELGKIYEDVVGYDLYHDLKSSTAFVGKSDQDIKMEILRMMNSYDKAKGSENKFANYYTDKEKKPGKSSTTSIKGFSIGDSIIVVASDVEYKISHIADAGKTIKESANRIITLSPIGSGGKEKRISLQELHDGVHDAKPIYRHIGKKSNKSSAVEKQKGLKSLSVKELEDAYTSATKKHDRARIVNEFYRRLNMKSLPAGEREEINAFMEKNGIKMKTKKDVMLMDGRPINTIPCDELVAMLEERRQRHSKSERKSKTKPVMKKITTDITQAVGKAIDDIPASKLKKDKKKIIAGLKNLKKKAGEFAQAFKTVLGSDYEASNIKTMLTEIEKHISELENQTKD